MPGRPQSEIAFCVAGLEVLLRSTTADGLGDLAGFYRDYPSSGRPPHLDIEVEPVADFADGRELGPEHPAFRCVRLGPGAIELSRIDAQGEITLPQGDPSGPVRGRFRGRASKNTLEAIVRIGASIAMPRLGGLILHASAIARDGQASIFAGVSGAGKSTIAALIAGISPAFGKISEELVIVRPDDRNRWSAHVTPFIGGDGLPHRTSAPISGIHFLEQAPFHRRTRIAIAAALRELLRHVLVYAKESDTASRVLAAASQLTEQIPCYRLQFAKDPAVVEVLDIT